MSDRNKKRARNEDKVGKKRLNENGKERGNGEKERKHRENRDISGACVWLGVVALNAKLSAVSQTATTNARGGLSCSFLSYSLSFCGFPEPAEAHFSLGTSGWWPPSNANRVALINGCATGNTHTRTEAQINPGASESVFYNH